MGSIGDRYQDLICFRCRHLYGDVRILACRAFPAGIPADHPEGFSHDTPRGEQVGTFVYEALSPAEERPSMGDDLLAQVERLIDEATTAQGQE
jgi:hypothetical protein